jgi:hypothetical protein
MQTFPFQTIVGNYLSLNDERLCRNSPQSEQLYFCSCKALRKKPSTGSGSPANAGNDKDKRLPASLTLAFTEI